MGSQTRSRQTVLRRIDRRQTWMHPLKRCHATHIFNARGPQVHVLEERAQAHDQHLVAFAQANGEHQPKAGALAVLLVHHELLGT
jgi:hypothetical protein